MAKITNVAGLSVLIGQENRFNAWNIGIGSAIGFIGENDKPGLSIWCPFGVLKIHAFQGDVFEIIIIRY